MCDKDINVKRSKHGFRKVGGEKNKFSMSDNSIKKAIGKIPSLFNIKKPKLNAKSATIGVRG